MIISIPIAAVVGILYGMILNKIKGSEMMIATYSGYTAVAVMCIAWMAFPIKNAEIRWPQGNGVRSIVSLTGKYENDIRSFFEKYGLQMNSYFPQACFSFVGLMCLLVWIFDAVQTWNHNENGRGKSCVCKCNWN